MDDQHLPAVREQRPPRPTIHAGARPTAIVPQTLDEAYRLSAAIHASGLAPKDFNSPERIMIAVMMGAEVGLTPMAAIQRIAVVNGRASVWGDAAIGLVRASGQLEWIKELFEGKDDDYRAVCTVKRKGDPEPISQSFSVADAKRGGLWGKGGPWSQYPKRMLQMRARAFALRDVFADVLGGLYLREELEEEVRQQPAQIQHQPAQPEKPRIAAPPPPGVVAKAERPKDDATTEAALQAQATEIEARAENKAQSIEDEAAEALDGITKLLAQAKSDDEIDGVLDMYDAEINGVMDRFQREQVEDLVSDARRRLKKG